MAIGLEVAFLPGLALARNLDYEGDWKRHLLLTPSLGLLICLGLAGVNFVLGWSLETLTWLIIASNILALIAIRVEIDRRKEKDIIERSPWFWIFTVIACYIAVIPLIFLKPMGVDWIGFSTLTDSLSKTGGFNLSYPSIGEWIYPPAFPTFAAWLGGESYLAVFWLGTICFASLLLGIAAVGEKLGCGHWTIMAMLMAPALFAKNLDSGYPTVTSQLGIIVMLLLLGNKIRWEIVTITTVFVALIHPTGLIYLSTLLFAQLLSNRHVKISLSNKIQFGILLASIAIVVAALLPAFTGTAVFAEYGWQGGTPMLFYSGFLIPLAIWSAWTLRDDKTAKIFTIWFALNWILSSIHLLEGLRGFTILSMLSYALYSMSMHAFHIPLAGLVGLRLSKIEGGYSSKNSRAVMIVTLILCGIASSAISELSEHDELHAVSQGDLNIFAALDDLPSGSVVYTENEHWGHVFVIPEHLGVTAVPTLGILQQEYSIQNAATTAIIYDDVERLNNLGITHAIASPKGVIMQYIQASTNWKKISWSEGSALYELQPDNYVSEFVPVKGENMRIDPWFELRSLDPFDLGNQKTYITSGIHTFSVNDTKAHEVCIMTEFVGNVEAKINSVLVEGSGWYNICQSAGIGEFEISVISESKWWINPMGASGRGDALIDQTGIRVHWIEIISSA